MEIGKRLREYRLKIGQSALGMAKKTGITSQNIINIEKDRVSPSINNVEKICNCLGITIQFVDKEGNLI